MSAILTLSPLQFRQIFFREFVEFSDSTEFVQEYSQNPIRRFDSFQRFCTHSFGNFDSIPSDISTKSLTESSLESHPIKLFHGFQLNFIRDFGSTSSAIPTASFLLFNGIFPWTVGFPGIQQYFIRNSYSIPSSTLYKIFSEISKRTL